MMKLIYFEKGRFWFKGTADNKFDLTAFAVSSFDDLKKIFKFKNENWILEICNYKVKKINYNFYINNKRVTKKEVVDLFKKCKKEF